MHRVYFKDKSVFSIIVGVWHTASESVSIIRRVYETGRDVLGEGEKNIIGNCRKHSLRYLLPVIIPSTLSLLRIKADRGVFKNNFEMNRVFF